MNTRELSKAITLLASIRDFQNVSIFKIKALQKIALSLKSLDADAVLNGLCDTLFSEQSRVWIKQSLKSGVLTELEHAKSEIPIGILDFFKIKGVGPKKWRMVYDTLGIADLSALEHACKANALTNLKGFGNKTQALILDQISFIKQNANKYLFSEAYVQHVLIEQELIGIPDFKFALTGSLVRHSEIIECLEYLVSDIAIFQKAINALAINIPVKAIVSDLQNWTFNHVKTIGPESYLNVIGLQSTEHTNCSDDTELHAMLNCAYVPPPRRDAVKQKDDLLKYSIQSIDRQQLKGILHVHTQYSDGANSISEMAQYAKHAGYSYLGITDHSQSAFYANGLSLNRLYQQWDEIEQWNATFPDFYIFKGIESDIRADGSLDYTDAELKGFDFIIASVHNGLQMDEAKATARLIKAIEHPATHILGHMTGRLLLKRSGYPVNTSKIIEACAKNNVAIELNANPYRLDIDWRWIDYALEQGVWISINPDAHSCAGIDDVFFGICMAQKTLLTTAQCLNAQDKNTVRNFFKHK